MINKKTMSNFNYKCVNLAYLNNYVIVVFEIPLITLRFTSNKRVERTLFFESLYKSFFALSIRGAS